MDVEQRDDVGGRFPFRFFVLVGQPDFGQGDLGHGYLGKALRQVVEREGRPLSCSLSRAHPLRISAIHAMPKAISREMNNKNSQIREDPTGLNRVVNLV